MYLLHFGSDFTITPFVSQLSKQQEDISDVSSDLSPKASG